MSSDSKRVDEPRREQAFTLLLNLYRFSIGLRLLGDDSPLGSIAGQQFGCFVPLDWDYRGLLRLFIPFFLALHVGAATDQYGPRLLIIIGSLGFAAAMVIIAVFPSVSGILISQTLAGICQLCSVVAFQTYASSIGSSQDLESNFGWYTAAGSVGQLTGPILGGLIADHISYQATFWISALLSVATAVVISILPKVKPIMRGNEGLYIDKPLVRDLLRRGVASRSRCCPALRCCLPWEPGMPFFPCCSKV